MGTENCMCFALLRRKFYPRCTFITIGFVMQGSPVLSNLREKGGESIFTITPWKYMSASAPA